MKNKQVAGLLLATVLAMGTFGMTGCGNGSTSVNSATVEEAEDYVLSFVAADKTNWDKEVTLGGHTYKIAINLKDNNCLTMKGTCTGEAQEEETAGGMGAMGFGAQGSGAESDEEAEPGTDGETEAVETQTAGAEESTESADYSTYNFEITGTWTYEDGWGYTLSFDDSNATVVTADFDKASSRQYFYMNLSITEDGTPTEAAQVQFQAEDHDFRSEIADDYVIAEERNAVYMFSVKGQSMNGNATNATIYLDKGGSVAVINLSGSSTTYSIGTWSEDETAHVLTINVDGETIVSDYCNEDGKEGYRINYSGTNCYAPISDGCTASDFSDVDFEGEVIASGTCAEGDFTVELTEKGYLKIYQDGSALETIQYSYDEEADAYSFAIDGVEITTEKDGDVYTFSATLSIYDAMQAMFGGEANTCYDRTFTITK